MSTHGRAEQIAADCINVPLRRCMPFREFCIHTLTSSPDIGQPVNPEAGSYGCMANTTNAGTQVLPFAKTPSNVISGELYGKTSTALTMPFYYKSADLSPWLSRLIIGGGDPYSKATAGPAIEQGHMVTQVRRRDRGAGGTENGGYLNRYNFEFTDATSAINSEADWLRFLHPAGYFWTNKGLNNPFMATDYYEQTGQFPTTTDSYNKNFIPFCDPLDVYSDLAGTDLIGQFVGWSIIFFFGFAYFKVPTDINLAEDYHINPQTVPPTLVDPENQFMSLDCHIYMTASQAYTGSPIYSPRIQSIRYWLYNKFGTTYNPCSPYLYILNGDAESEWKFDLTFNKTTSGTQVIKTGISNLQMYITP